MNISFNGLVSGIFGIGLTLLAYFAISKQKKVVETLKSGNLTKAVVEKTYCTVSSRSNSSCEVKLLKTSKVYSIGVGSTICFEMTNGDTIDVKYLASLDTVCYASKYSNYVESQLKFLWFVLGLGIFFIGYGVYYLFFLGN